VNKSQVAAVAMWLARGVRQDFDVGVSLDLTMYWATVVSPAWCPSSASSSTIRGAPQVGFSSDMRRIRVDHAHANPSRARPLTAQVKDADERCQARHVETVRCDVPDSQQAQRCGD
jgi:hypothetical protein